jgi:release factor glutamine methyltransferase
MAHWVNILQTEGVEDARKSVEIILAHFLSCPRLDVITFSDTFLKAFHIADKELIEKALEKRTKHCPLAKIIGMKEFYGYAFNTSVDTLDPRPDSEILIDTALAYIKKDHKNTLQMLDLGTGTGCLLLTLLMQRPNLQGIGLDRSLKALRIAQHNAERFDLIPRVHWVQSSWITSFCPKNTFDIIISNPPYIDAKTSLDTQTLWDPSDALFAPKEGFEYYDHFSKNLKPYLNPQGYLFLEIGAGQAQKVIFLFKKQGWQHLLSQKDLAGIERCLVFQP